MDETFKYIYNEVFENYVPEYFKDIGYTPWIFSLLGSALIGLSGILPLFVIPIETGGKDSDFNRKLHLFLNMFFLQTEILWSVTQGPFIARNVILLFHAAHQFLSNLEFDRREKNH